MKIGFIGCGKMASTMADVLQGMDGFELYACAARDIDKAKVFKNKHSFLKVYENYEDLCNDDLVDIIYISTVTKTHYDLIKVALNHHKNVLCEKPFCLNYEESKEVVELAREKKLLLVEALWTRFFNSSHRLKELIDSKIIGNVYAIKADIGYQINQYERMQDPIGGGVLLDCGVYPINFALMLNDSKIIDYSSFFTKSKSGVDEEDFLQISFENGVNAYIYCSMKSNIDCSGYVYGDKGYIKVDHVNHPSKIEIFDGERPPRLIKSLNFKHPRGGYEYQWLEIANLIKNNKKESVSMPLDETLKIMNLLDQLKK